MNWKVVFILSIFGLIVALGTISLIPQRIESSFWLMIYFNNLPMPEPFPKLEAVIWLIVYIFSGYIIAKFCSNKFFLQGFIVSVLNSLWILIFHIVYFNSYIPTHTDMISLFEEMSTSHPKLTIAFVNLAFGVLAGIVLGLFSFITSKIVRNSFFLSKKS